MNSLNNDSVFTIWADFSLSGEDRAMLLKSYLPIIGNDGYSLFNLLYQLSQEQNDSYHNPLELREQMDGDLSKLNSALYLLEGMSLLSTFRYEDKNKCFYIYRLNKPLSPKSFFSNKEYLALLISKIGERRIKEITSYFSYGKTIPAKYIDVSCSFSDVFDVDVTDPSLNDLNGLTLNMRAEEAEHFNGKFNLEDFKKETEKLQIDYKIIAPFEGTVFGLCNLFALDSQTAGHIIKDKCITSNNVFSLETFKKNAKDYYHFHIEDAPSKIQIIEFGTSDMAKKIKLFNTLSPIEYVSAILKVDPSKRIRDMIEKLFTDFRISSPLINVIVDYSFQKCQGKVVDTYIYSVASSFPSHDFSSANEAMTYLYQGDQKINEWKARKESSYKKALAKANKGEETNQKADKSTDQGPINLADVLGDDI